MRAVDQRDPSVFGGSLNWFAGLGVFLQLVEIPTAEFLPSLRVMPEPFPQRGAWTDLFQPGVNAQRRFLNATRPEPLDEETLSIFRSCLVVDTLELNHFCSPL